ncbi:MAG: hypothetical protein FNT29_01735 [Halothiobacillaceae bacterium]|nr:MAG: hypothetical protein FNT29_01735 [Halothiobacillaceae bacterium]
MNPILIFASIFLGLALTLLFGPQSGIMIGILAYLAGSSTLHSRELVKLQMEFQQRMSEIPDIVNELVEQKLRAFIPKEATSMAPAGDVPTTAAQALPPPTENPAIDERFLALDHKLSALVDLLVAREARTPEAAPVPVKTQAPPSAGTMPPAAAPAPLAPVTPSGAARREAVEADEARGKEHEAELAAMRELVEKMAAMLTLQEAAAHDPRALMPEPAETARPAATGNQRPSFDHLRAELDKITHELQSELDRPKKR